MNKMLPLTAVAFILAISAGQWRQSEAQADVLAAFAFIGGLFSLTTATALGVYVVGNRLMDEAAMQPDGGTGYQSPMAQFPPQQQGYQPPRTQFPPRRPGRSADDDHSLHQTGMDNPMQKLSEIIAATDPAECYQLLFCDMATTSEGFEASRPILWVLEKEKIQLGQLSTRLKEVHQRLEMAFQIGQTVKSEPICESIYQCPQSGQEVDADVSNIEKHFQQLSDASNEDVQGASSESQQMSSL